jgi:hypothetical protein
MLMFALALIGSFLYEVYQPKLVSASEAVKNQSLINENADWQPQDYFDSQGITDVKFEAGILNLTAHLIGGDPNLQKGEVWLDLRYFPVLEGKVPIDMSQRTITVEAEVPPEFSGNPNKPNGLQVFVKQNDTKWTPKYGDWVNINSSSSKYVATLKPTLSNIIIIGVKFAIGDNSAATFSGQLYVTKVTVNPPLELTPPPPLPQSAPAPRYAKGDLVTVDSNGFFLNGKEWFMVGGNFRGLEYGQSFGVTDWFVWGNGVSRHPNFVKANFDNFRRAGAKVIRVELLADGRAMFDREGHVTGYNDRFHQDVETFLEIAYEEGIKVEFTLADFLIAGKAENVSGVWLRGRSAIITNETLETEYINQFLIPFLEEFGGHPALIGFDVMNEPEWILSQNDGGDWEHADNETKADDNVPIEPWRNFIDDCISAIRTYAPGKLVTVGVSINFMALVEDFNTDYFAFHYYPSMGNLSDYVPKIPIGKPWSLEEYPTHNTSVRISEYLDFTLNSGGAGALLWNLSPAIDDFAFSYAERDERLLELNDWVTKHEGLDIDNLAGWYWVSHTTIASLASGNLDSDKQNEIVSGGYYNDGTRNIAQLCVWDGLTLALENIKVWYWTGDTVINSVALGDVDGDGEVEVVTGGYYNDGVRNVSQLVFWNGANLVVENIKTWYWTGDTVINSVAATDVDGDGQTEVVTGGTFFDGTRHVAQLCVWSGTDLSLENVKTWWWTGDTVINSIAVGDVDGVGEVEVVSGGYYFDGVRWVAQLCVWSGDGLGYKSVKTWFWTGDTVVNCVVLGDVDGDGGVEVVSGGYYFDGIRRVAQLCVWSGLGLGVENVKVWYWVGNTVINSVALGDVDGNGVIEVVSGGYYFDGLVDNSQMVVWRGPDLSVCDIKVWRWVGNTAVNAVVVSDVNRDFSNEIVTGGRHNDGTFMNSQLVVWGITPPHKIH